MNPPPKTTYTPFFYRELQHTVAPAYGVAAGAFWDPVLKGYSNWSTRMLSAMTPRFAAHKERGITPRFTVRFSNAKALEFEVGAGMEYRRQLASHALGTYKPRYSANVVARGKHANTPPGRQVISPEAGWLLPAQGVNPLGTSPRDISPPGRGKGKR